MDSNPITRELLEHGVPVESTLYFRRMGTVRIIFDDILDRTCVAEIEVRVQTRNLWQEEVGSVAPVHSAGLMFMDAPASL